MDYIDYYTNSIFCYDKGNYDKLRIFIQNESQNINTNNESDVNYIWNQMKLVIREGVEKYVPNVKTISNSKKFHKIGDDLKNDIKRKNRLWTRYRETNNKEVEKSNKELRNNIKNKIKKIIQDEQKNIARCCKTNPKKFWKYIKLKTKNINKIGSIEYVDDFVESKIAHAMSQTPRTPVSS